MDKIEALYHEETLAELKELRKTLSSTGNAELIKNIQMVKGDQGEPGVSIKSISTETNDTSVVIHIEKTDGASHTFEVERLKGLDGRNGTDGADGKPGEKGLDGVNGKDGKPGIQGPIGKTGAKGQAGRSLIWRGEWSNNATYSVDDVTSYQGSSYIATKNNPTGYPVSSDGWDLVARKGADGRDGVNGVSTDGGTQSGGTGAATWGTISGTLSSQTDLQSALNAKANTSSLAPVATSGSYTDLTSKPTIPATFDDLAAGTTNKAYTATEKTKLAGVATGATANDTDANLKNRANHTGTQTASTISDFSTAADARISAQRGAAGGVASLDGAGKVPVSQLPNSIMEYQGTWNASTNTPTLADGAGNTGDVYRVTVSGTQNFGSGAITFVVSDYAIYNGSTWEKADTTDAVSSVNGFAGAVVLAKTDIGLGNVDNTSDATKNSAAATLTNKDLTSGTNTFPTFNQNTSGTAANLSGTPALPNGTTATTQSAGDNSTKLATTAYANAAVTAGQSAVRTLTNARITKRVFSATSTATLTPEIDTYDCFTLTAQAAALNIANHSTSTPSDFDKLEIRLLDNGTARAITYGTNYVAGGVPLPSTTVVNKLLTLGFEWNSSKSKYYLIAASQEA